MNNSPELVDETTIQRNFENIRHPEIFASVAQEIQQHVKKNQLTSNIKGKVYPHVEAWQFSGALLGLFPKLISLEDIGKDGFYRYKATVNIIESSTGNIVGSGVAICSNSEKSKQYFDEYAIASMAQTRAVGKAFRLCLGWLLKAAGFEPTSAEEMDSHERSPSPHIGQLKAEYKKFALLAVEYCTKSEETSKLAKLARTFHDDPQFIDKVKAIHKSHLDAGL